MAWQLMILAIAMMTLLGVLLWGIVTMARGGSMRGGEYNVRWSNKIMRYRVLFQAIALLIFVVILLMASRN